MSAPAFAVQVLFKFGLMTSMSPETPAVAPVEDQNKRDAGSVNALGNSFSVSSSANHNTTSSIFGFNVPASNGTTSDTQGSISFGVSNGTSQIPASTSSLGLSSSTPQTVPFQFGSSASTFSCGLAGNTNTSSGSSLFGSSADVKFSMGTSLGITSSSSSESTVVSSSSSGSSGGGSSNHHSNHSSEMPMSSI
ncbi:hypothetical protein MLD38_034323 [Melastoma candidum]|uniref:Uncharacterized protein n=1 Tax=Melastoma candidum TaxID=119954 RepID=A0ACB9M9K1_9MYRT|nr:hypothetical protein MLD38_034323 [Melastoma candidum]